MRIKQHNNGYTIWLSKNDTYDWAHKLGSVWPCSTVSGKSLKVVVDNHGLCELTVDGKINSPSIDSHELQSIISDYLPEDLHKYWPIWYG